VLSCNLPVNSESRQSSFIKAFGGELNSNFYGLQYYDSTFHKIENEHSFQISLTGFMSGRAGDSMLKGYSALVIDTAIGGTVGLMGKFTSTDSSKFYRRVDYYVTLANNHYYWFYAYSTSPKNEKEIDSFFNSIKFDSDKLKEKTFKLTPIYLKTDQL
jgi:hypothetical protein